MNGFFAFLCLAVFLLPFALGHIIDERHRRSKARAIEQAKPIAFSAISFDHCDTELVVRRHNDKAEGL